MVKASKFTIPLFHLPAFLNFSPILVPLVLYLDIFYDIRQSFSNRKTATSKNLQVDMSNVLKMLIFIIPAGQRQIRTSTTLLCIKKYENY